MTYAPSTEVAGRPDTAAPAVTYLRVSTREQAEKGRQDEGFSIPTQREANHRKAEALGATIPPKSSSIPGNPHGRPTTPR